MKTGIELIAEERRRQIEVKGWNLEHDAYYDEEELARAGAYYSLPADFRRAGSLYEHLWPWDDEWYKPTPDDRIRELSKAGALIAAEIDRIQNYKP